MHRYHVQSIQGTYYSIDVVGQIAPGSAYPIVQNCYIDGGERAFCRRITRNAAGYINQVVEGFVNSAPLSIRGVDFNFQLNKAFRVARQTAEFSFELAGNYDIKTTSGTGLSALDLTGTGLYPRLKAVATTQLRVGPWTATWYTNFIDRATTFGNVTLIPGQTCLPTENITCHPYGEVARYWAHNAALAWSRSGLVISLGINNVFNTPPPRVTIYASGTGGTNTLLNGNYDPFGRTAVLQIRRSF